MSKTILITGGAGYIGSQLIRDLAADETLREGSIRIYDNLQSNKYHTLMDLPGNACYQFIEGDILDRISLAEAMQGVWAVVHMAAIVSTPISFDYPRWTHQINHWGTSTVIEQAIQAGVEHLIYTCSASVYGPGGPFEEDAPCNPIGPYSVSKLQGEEIVMQAGQQRGLKVTSLRLGNVVGKAPGIRFDAVANRLAYLASVGKPLIVQGNGTQKRPFIHIKDASSAIRFCLANEQSRGMILNAVSENISVNDLIEAIESKLPDTPVRYTGQDMLAEISFEINGQRLRELGWQPKNTITAGMGEIIDSLSPLHRKKYTNVSET